MNKETTKRFLKVGGLVLLEFTLRRLADWVKSKIDAELSPPEET